MCGKIKQVTLAATERTRDSLVNEPRNSLAFSEWFLLALLLIVFGAHAFLPAWRTTNTDFPNYYLAAMLHRQGTPLDRAYEWRWFQRHKDYLQIDQPLVDFAPHPPLCAAPMLPLALPALEAKRVWLILNAGFLWLAVWILHHVTQLSWRRLLLLTFLCVRPLQENFQYGQYYVLILLLVCLAYYAHCRGHHFTSGAVISVAAALKIFPVLFLFLFLRKRDWGAVLGLVAGGITLAAVSVLVFGWDVHRIYLLEVLPRALRGEMLEPYNLQWNSFGALWHHLFLAEPAMNPSPLWNSPGTFAFLQAITATALLFNFLLRTSGDESPHSAAWEWASFLPLLLLLSSMPAVYHHCLLIFTAIVAFDELLKRDAGRSALIVVVLFVLACLPLPPTIWLRLQGRLIAVFLLYVVALSQSTAQASAPTRRIMFALASVLVAAMTFSNLRLLKNRSDDFARRIPGTAGIFAVFAAAPTQTGLVVEEMYFSHDLQAYRALQLPDKHLLPLPAAGDVLSVAASPGSPFLYFELTDRRSEIFRLRSTPTLSDTTPKYIADGQDPTISADGRWLAFLKTEHGGTTIWLSENGGPPALAPGSQAMREVLEMTVTNQGDVIAASGSPANSHLSVLHADSGQIERLSRIAGPLRYPTLSADGHRLAFSRRESGSWHLFVRDFALDFARATESERQLTTGTCNATHPVWENSRSLLYVTDCGRGLGLGALARVPIPP